MMVRQEVQRLGSRWLNQQLMYPGLWLFTWVKTPFMPWMLASIEPFEEGET